MELSDQIRFLEEMYDALNQQFFGGWLIRPVITILSTSGISRIYRISPNTVNNTERKAKSSPRKYQCSSCGARIRTTKKIKLLCGICLEELEVI